MGSRSRIEEYKQFKSVGGFLSEETVDPEERLVFVGKRLKKLCQPKTIKDRGEFYQLALERIKHPNGIRDEEDDDDDDDDDDDVEETPQCFEEADAAPKKKRKQNEDSQPKAKRSRKKPKESPKAQFVSEAVKFAPIQTIQIKLSFGC